jgi:glutathione S-transferase kappa 1
LVYIKKNYPADVFESVYLSIFTAMFENEADLSKPLEMLKALESSFPAAEAEKILKSASDPEVKAALTANTERAWKELGAFGVPWCWVDNGKGKPEPFFGSDRFHHMWQFLEIPFRDLALEAKL